MADMKLLVIQGIVVLVGFLVYHQYFRRRVGPSLPPGPKPLPIVGNLGDLPPKNKPEYQHWLQHKERYGLISSVTVLSETLIIIHDRQAARDLLEKKSKDTSGRPKMKFAHELCGFDRFLPGQQFDETYRRQRRHMHQQLGTKLTAARYNNIQEVEVRRFLLRVLNDPEHLIQHFKTLTGAIILMLTYGYSIAPAKADPLVHLIERMMSNFSSAFVPLAWLVDIVPALAYLPDGFPGTAFKDTARQWKNINKAVAEVPYSFTRRQMESRSDQPSFVSRLIRQAGSDSGQLCQDDEEIIKNSAAILYGGGADTTVSNLTSFVLAMTLFPEVQRKAQEEIDSVTGADRLPQYQDQDKLPYTEAIAKEALRWLPVAPMGTAHTVEEDTVYNGYVFPKGAHLIPAIWWFTHDPEVYHEPDSFSPERYLEPRSEPDPGMAVFGFGRRRCPGQFIARSNLFLTIAQILAAFDITKAVDERGVEIETKLESTAGLIAHPVDFKYKIEPRSAKHADLIRRIEVEQPWGEGDASHIEGMAEALLHS